MSSISWKRASAVLIAIVPIYAIYIAVMINWELYLASLLIILSLPAIVGQIFLVIGLIKLEKWAWTTFVFISLLSVILGLIEMLALDVVWSVDIFLNSFFEVSLIVMPVLGVSLIVRKMLGRSIY